MKALMIMPSIDNGYWKKLGKKVGPKSEPLSLLYIATFLNSKGHQVEVLDCEAEGISLEELELNIRKKDYDIIGVAMLTSMYTQSINVCKIVKKINPKIKVIVGGSHATLRPTQTLEDNKDCIDIVMIGEAELTMLKIVEAFQGKIRFKDIKGIAYKDKDGKVHSTGEAEKIQDLDFFPIPNRDLINMKSYRPSVSYFKKLPAYTMITTRGCPHRCIFCATAKTGYRMHSIPRVIEEMKILIEKYGAKEILFRDDTFTLNRKRTIDLCDAIIKEGLHKNVIWDCITRAGSVDYELLKKMKEASCWGMHFGIEGGSQKQIDIVQKDTKIETIKDAFKWCRKLGIETRAYMMIGLPNSTYEDDLQVINFAKELNPDWAQFTITMPYPGTELFEKAKHYGELTSSSSKWDNYQTWGGFSDTELPWVSKGRSSEELKALQRKALRSFYFRPKIILRKSLSLHSFAMFKKFVLGASALLSGGSGRNPE